MEGVEVVDVVLEVGDLGGLEGWRYMGGDGDFL